MGLKANDVNNKEEKLYLPTFTKNFYLTTKVIKFSVASTITLF